MRDPILIAGGGIGGLAAALSLAENGVASRVFERRAEPTEEGAGIQIGPNGTRILRRLGVARLLEQAVARPEALRIMSAAKGLEVARLPLGSWIEKRHGAPYWTAHRQDLHASLLERAAKSSLIEISFGRAVVSAEQSASSITAVLDTGARATGQALVGADGLWSTLRRNAMGAEAPVFTGKIAARAVVPTNDLEPIYGQNVHIWLAPGAHVVHYPVRGGRELAIVVILDGDEESDGWAQPLAPLELAIKMSRVPLAKPLESLLARAGSWRLWSLQGLRRPVAFAKGRLALIGDAAHPVLPFLAQGAVLALEDSEALADALRVRTSVEDAFAIYRERRARRAHRVVRASAMNGRIYHLEGPAAFVRNLVLGHAPPTRIMAGLDWLYGYKP